MKERPILFNAYTLCITEEERRKKLSSEFFAG